MRKITFNYRKEPYFVWQDVLPDGTVIYVNFGKLHKAFDIISRPFEWEILVGDQDVTVELLASFANQDDAETFRDEWREMTRAPLPRASIPPQDRNGKRWAVHCYENGVTYRSANHAAKALGLSVSGVANALRGVSRGCAGYHFTRSELPD